jgi:hypothetical protein
MADVALPASAEFEQLRTRLLLPPERPTWGPKVGTRAARVKRGFSNLVSNPARNREPGVLSSEERRQIEENYETHRRIYDYRWMYIFAAAFSAVVALLALFVDYHIIAADVWTRALADEFGVVPDSLKESVIYKSLQVVFATLAVHFLLKITGGFGRFVMVLIVCIVTFAMIGGLGFVVANNNLAAGASGIRAVESDNNQLGDALTQLGLKPANQASTIPTPSFDSDETAGAAATQEPTLIAKPESGKCPSGFRQTPDKTQCQKSEKTGDALVNLNLQDWFVFKALPEEWRKNAQVNLWLIFVGVIFFIITTVAALYLQSAERNIRNAFDAAAFKQRERDYNTLMGAVHNEPRSKRA